MISLDTPIEKLSKVGPKTAPKLKHLGIHTVRDLLKHYPNRYEDFSNMGPIADIQEKGQIVSVKGKVTEIASIQTWRRRMTITTAFVSDDSGNTRAVWFNQPYLESSLKEGTLVNLSGKVSLDKKGLYLSAPSFERTSISEDTTHTGRLVPIYPETYGIGSKYLRFLIKPLLKLSDNLPDPLPKPIINRYKFPTLPTAVRNIHFPETLEDVEAAKRRFAFEQLLTFQLRALIDRSKLKQLKALVIEFDNEYVGELISSLPFELTTDQRVALFEILKDLETAQPMSRLLNGDVGSGKTIVALITALQVIKAGNQAVIMAPTEILARQHFTTACDLTGFLTNKITTGLLVGSEAKQYPSDEITEEKITKKLMTKKIGKGQIKLIIGTHAIIQKNVNFKRLGLVVIDEQHRFGVAQRMRLVKTDGPVPHLLSMSATPIPRSLSLTMYGDLDVSLIRQKPKGRLEIKTRVVPRGKRDEAYKFIEAHIKSGRQVFVICPRIEISKADPDENKPDKPISQAKLAWAEVKAVTDEHEKLSKEIFPHRRVAMLHGKMKPVEKETIMAEFKKGNYDIVVSTSVIEVGVDIPNATIMMIESAERFGLSQLHQFRGRVGRGSHQSFCLLFVSAGDMQTTRRLSAMEKTNDGFKLAEMDLKIRGPGEFAGTRQSGDMDISMASLTNLELIKEVRAEAVELLKNDPNLDEYKLLRANVERMQKIVHFE